MKGGEVFKFAIEQAPSAIQKLLEYSHKSIEDIDFYAIHQANSQIVRTIINHAGIPREKASAETFTKFGNCGSSAVMTNLCDAGYGKNFKEVLLVTFGVGLSVGSCILNLENTYNGGISYMPTPKKVQSREEIIQEWTEYLKSSNM